MTMNRSDIAKQLEPGLNAVLGLAYARVQNQYQPLFDTENSDRSFEEMTNMSLLGSAPVKQEGAAITYDSMHETYTSRFTHETIALGFAITEETIEDQQYEDFGKRAADALGTAMAETKEVKGAAIFNNGFNTAYAGGDGSPLFHASHSTESGNQSNTVSSDLAETALENAVIAIADYKDERGLLVTANPVSLHIPRALMFVAERILKSQLSTTVNTQGATGVTNVNDTNALRNMGYFQRGVHVNDRFTDTNAWYIRTSAPKGTIMFKRKGLATETKADFETGNIRHKARERYCFGWGDWRQWYGSNGSS